MFNFGGGQLPSFGQMRPQMGGQQQMQPLGQMWQQPQQQQATGQLPPMGGQMQPMGQQQQGQQVGMVPGVPGSMGLNPGMGGPMQGQQGGFSGGDPTQRGQAMGQQQSAFPGGFGGQIGGGFMQNPMFQQMLQNPQAQAFLMAHPQLQNIMGGQMQPSQQPHTRFGGGGPMMRPMGA